MKRYVDCSSAVITKEMLEEVAQQVINALPFKPYRPMNLVSDKQYKRALKRADKVGKADIWDLLWLSNKDFEKKYLKG